MPEIKTDKNKRTSHQDTSQKLAFIKTFIFSLIAYLCVYFISCFVALAFDINDKYDLYFSLLSFSFASFLSGFFGGNKLRKNGLVTGMLFALPTNFIVVLISAASVNFKPDITLLITVSILLLSSAAGGVFAVNKRHRR